MPKYIDADQLLADLQEELSYHPMIYTEEQNSWFDNGLKRVVRIVKSYQSADVVPRAEVMRLVGECYDKCDECRSKIADTVRAEVARFIFEEIERLTAAAYNHFMFDRKGVGMNTTLVVEFSDEIDREIAELKKKYTEGG